ncbi:pre-toxin TG domain-containing protein [Caldifermentibacillus hisashii]|uniref:pre-toxin TG domain-containing protein n=1 Tax=Caldifermentibacillus hisashii TaxID=996558 RepID=UPI0031346F52
MSKIKVKFDDLEEFADKIGKVERECDEALEALNWHFTSLLSNFPGVLPDSIHALEYELRYSINEYKNKLDEAQRLIRLTAAEMEKDEQKMGNKVSEFLLELVGWNDAKRIVSEYDPVTGEKLSFGDRVLAGGFLALSLLPPAKAVGIAGKTLIKGVDARIPALAKTPGVLKKIRNVLDPKKVQQVFHFVYDQVVNSPIALTKAWFDTIKKEIGEIRLPQVAQEAYAGIGVAERTVKDAFSDAKDLIQRIKNTKFDEWNVGGITKGTGKIDYVEETGRLGGKRYSEKDLKLLGNYLEKRGVTLKVGDEFLPPGKGGGFNYNTGELVLKSHPTQYEVWHELSHYIQYKQIGREAYSNLPRTSGPVPMNDLTKFNAPEQFVYDMLSNNPKRWNSLNEAEQLHANWYITQYGGIR